MRLVPHTFTHRLDFSLQDHGLGILTDILVGHEKIQIIARFGIALFRDQGTCFGYGINVDQGQRGQLFLLPQYPSRDGGKDQQTDFKGQFEKKHPSSPGSLMLFKRRIGQPKLPCLEHYFNPAAQLCARPYLYLCRYYL